MVQLPFAATAACLPRKYSAGNPTECMGVDQTHIRPVDNLARLCHFSDVLDAFNLQHAYRRIFWNERHGNVHSQGVLYVMNCTLAILFLQYLSMTTVLARMV